jgi:hypothetical protein
VIEALPDGRGQGHGAFATLAQQKPFAGRAILFGGDDTTDLDVFRILPRSAAGLFGRPALPGADYIFESPRRCASGWCVWPAWARAP